MLVKGEKFVVTPNPKTVPVEDIIFNVEVSIRNLPHVVTQKNRQGTASVLLRATLPKCSLSVRDLSALRDLRRNESIVVQPVDKGSATFALNNKDYRIKIRV